MSEIEFLRDAHMARDAFEQLPLCGASNGAAIVEMAKAFAGRTCRVLIERDGRAEWHALAWLHLNGTKRLTAARIKFGRYRHED